MSRSKWFKTLTATGLIVLGIATGQTIYAQSKSQATTPSTPTAVNKANTTSAPMGAQEAAIAKAFELKFEGSKVKSVTATPFKDLYEVVLSTNEIAYTNSATEYVMVGNLINASDMRNLTNERTEQMAKTDFKSLPLDQAFTLVKGNGKRHIAVFEDPNCGYCKLFRKTLEKVDNISVHTFVIDILGADSTAKAKTLLCAADPAHAWDDWMLHGKIADAKSSCNSTATLEKNNALAQKLGVSGTPTIYFENGSRAPGAIGADDLEKMFKLIDKQ